ncbi:MAG: zinc ABC transporter substrate-binding protein, partial [Caldilineaceae bacterium]|nr:zinc ABC transporter substrate-binding protein [Caldilineaceae bacterium]
MMPKVSQILLSLLLFIALSAACGAPTPAATDTPNATAQPSDEHTHEDAAAPTELPSFEAADLSDGGKLQVVATTNILADVVAQVTDDNVDLYGMLPVGADPHSYQPTPQDLRALTDADVVFVNGLGLEEAMALALEDFAAKTVVVNTGIEAIAFGGEHAHEEEAHSEESHDEASHAEDEHAEEADHDHAHEGADPHTWFSVHVVETWTHNIAHVLSDL